LLAESLPFFFKVSLKEFLFTTEWTPLFENAKYGILPLLSGTLTTSLIALVIAIPLGTIIATYLSEFANDRWREILKPVLELLAAVPTVVYGYFAFLFVTPLLEKIFPQISGFNVLSAGLVMGVMIIPYVSSLSEDSMRSVSKSLREGSMALGASKFETAFKVVYPSAFSGITSAYILGISRAFGETMVVAIAAGMQPQISYNPLEPAATITAYIVQVSLGDLPHGSIGYQTIYVAGLTLLIITLIFNMLGFWIKNRYQEKE
ncbi:MAG TPA: phosphate ABC transporter permease subunit PstC, partial [Pseudobdellovibrionaceae bacterium]|nr:phosphate ABC transporter permease subunit PstC [Pseudobdellovibrionaceae bacterium]